jgi:hypothetical protein
MRTHSHMVFGHNTNVKAGDATFHVQTEDHGTVNPLIDTTVYYQGRVLHRRANHYFDLLPLTADTEAALRMRVDDQHKTVVEEIRSGVLRLTLPASPADAKPVQEVHPSAASNPASAEAPPILLLELLNAKSWLAGKRASLQIAVRDSAARALENAKVTARVEGAAEPTAFTTMTGPFGHAQLEFDMPRLASPDAAIVIEASDGAVTGHLKFHLRAKPRVPSLG